jgi:hypothetical protein
MPKKRNTTHVVPNKEKGGWDVKKAGRINPFRTTTKNRQLSIKLARPVKRIKAYFISMVRMEKSNRKTAVVEIHTHRKVK